MELGMFINFITEVSFACNVENTCEYKAKTFLDVQKKCIEVKNVVCYLAQTK